MTAAARFGPTGLDPATRNAAPAKGKPGVSDDTATVAKQFESMLLSELMKAMRASTQMGDDDSGAFASGTYQEMMDQALVDAGSGGLGLASSLERQLGGALAGSVGAPAGSVGAPSRSWQPPRAIPEELAAIDGADAHRSSGRPGRAPKAVDRSAIIGTSFDAAAPQPGLWPVDGGAQSSGYGFRFHPIHKERRFHGGLDIAAPEGREIRAVQRGTVTYAERHKGYGNMVEITHPDGVVTRYAHASRLHVRVGDVVDVGEAIADVGSTGQSTGPHLHFEVRERGRTLDPNAYLERLRNQAQLVDAGGKPRTGVAVAPSASQLARDVNSEESGTP
jgi:YD repeat-containing protein